MDQARTLKDVFHVAGDQPDPMGGDLRGASMGYDLRKSAVGRPMLHYGLPDGTELILEADVYALPGEPKYIHLLCPRCLAAGRQNGLRITEERKAIEYDRAEPPPFPGWTTEQMVHAFPQGAGGTLSVESFACTWEEAPELRRGFGLARCPWKVVIEKNRVRDV